MHVLDLKMFEHASCLCTQKREVRAYISVERFSPSLSAIMLLNRVDWQ